MNMANILNRDGQAYLIKVMEILRHCGCEVLGGAFVGDDVYKHFNLHIKICSNLFPNRHSSYVYYLSINFEDDDPAPYFGWEIDTDETSPFTLGSVFDIIDVKNLKESYDVLAIVMENIQTKVRDYLEGINKIFLDA